MQDESTRKGLLNKNIQSPNSQEIQLNEKGKNKETIAHPKKVFKKKNHVHYYSKSSQQGNNNHIKKEPNISNKLSFNEMDDEEELDHPKPLRSDSEEDLDDLKAEFAIKSEEEETLDNILKNKQNFSLNLENIQNNIEIPEIRDAKQIRHSVIDDNKNEKKENIVSGRKMKKLIPLKKSYNSKTISINQVNQIKLKINKKLNNTDVNKNNLEKKEKKGNKNVKHNSTDNQINKEIIKNKKKNIYHHASLNLLKKRVDKNIKFEKKDSSKIGNENYNYVNIIKNDTKQYSEPRNMLIDNQNRHLYANSLPISKIKYQIPKTKNIIKEECEKNQSQEKKAETIPNKINLNQSQQKNLVLKKKKLISLKNINYLMHNEGIQSFASDIDEKDNVYLNENSYNKTEGNINIIDNFSKVKSNELQRHNLDKKFNIFENKQKQAQNNNLKYRKKTYEKGGKFNNIQTTFVVLSKNQNTNKIPKSKNNPEIIKNNKNNSIPSANNLNNTKINKGNIIPNSKYSNGINYQRMSVNIPRRLGSNSNMDNVPIRGSYNFNEYLYNKVNNDISYRNYLESSIIRDRVINRNNRERNTNYFINKSSNNTQNIIPFYDYDYDYNYDYYYNDNQFPNNSYIQYSINSNY